MGKHTAGYRIEDCPWTDALAIPQLHGIFPRWRYLSLNAR